jgi:bacillithiol synthase
MMMVGVPLIRSSFFFISNRIVYECGREECVIDNWAWAEKRKRPLKLLLVKGLSALDFVMRNEQTGNQLTDLHTMHFEQVSHLFDNQDPYQLETYRQRANQVAPMFSSLHRDALVDGLLSYLQGINASKESLRQVERLRDTDSVAVVTGQQAGLFTGPMYSISKALTVIGLAKSLEADLDRPVVPIFWIASEDHDWAEVNHAYILDHNDEVVRVSIQENAQPHQMVCHTKLSERAVDSCLRQIFEQLPEGQFKLEMVTELKAAWHEGDSLSLWYARIMAILFADHGLVMVDPCLPALRRLVVPVWKQAIFRHETVQKSLDEAYREVQSAGYAPQVIRDETNTTLFYVENCKRYVLEQASSVALRARGQNIEKGLRQWADLADLDASRFSSNVLLRPLVQDFLLPTLAYVGGPAEIAYHALSRGVFHAHGRILPPLVLRQRITLYPPSVQRVLINKGLTLEEITRQKDLVPALLREHGSDDIERTVSERMAEFQSQWTDFANRYEHLGPQVADIMNAYLEQSVANTERLKKKVTGLLERRLFDEIKQLRHVERWLWTDGHPQERRLCPLNIWAKYGHRFVSQLPLHTDYQSPAPMYHVYQ